MPESYQHMETKIQRGLQQSTPLMMLSNKYVLIEKRMLNIHHFGSKIDLSLTCDCLKKNLSVTHILFS